MRTGRRALPPIPVLQSLIDVVETGSVTRSAERLHLTQSAVSHHIARVEADLGVVLFERGDRSMRPTADAVRLAGRLSDLLIDLARTWADAGRPEAQPALRVAVASEILDHWLAARLSNFSELHPHVRIQVVADDRRDALADGGADLQLRLGCPGPEQGGFVLIQDEEIVVCAPSLAARLPARQAFAAAPLLADAAPSSTRLDWDRWLAAIYGRGDDWRRAMDLSEVRRLDGFARVLDACRSGGGFALARALLVADDIAAGALVVAVEERLVAELPVCVAHPLVPAPGVPAERFIAWLRLQVQPG